MHHLYDEHDSKQLTHSVFLELGYQFSSICSKYIKYLGQRIRYLVHVVHITHKESALY